MVKVADREYEILLTMINQHHMHAMKIEEIAGRDAAERWYERTAGLVDAFNTIYGDCRGEVNIKYDMRLHTYYAVPLT